VQATTSAAIGCRRCRGIVAQEACSERPNWEPDVGSWYVSQVVDIRASNPDVWSKT